ncbi:hypothetical protein JCM19992_32310 [Thermostilla marina]
MSRIRGNLDRLHWPGALVSALVVFAISCGGWLLRPTANDAAPSTREVMRAETSPAMRIEWRGDDRAANPAVAVSDEGARLHEALRERAHEALRQLAVDLETALAEQGLDADVTLSLGPSDGCLTVRARQSLAPGRILAIEQVVRDQLQRMQSDRYHDYANRHEDALAAERQLYQTRALCDRFLNGFFQEIRESGRRLALLNPSDLTAQQPAPPVGAQWGSSLFGRARRTIDPQSDLARRELHEIENRLMALREERAAKSATFTEQHPDIIRLDHDIAGLEVRRAAILRQIGEANASSDKPRIMTPAPGTQTDEMRSQIVSQAEAPNFDDLREHGRSLWTATCRYDQFRELSAGQEARWREAKLAESEAWLRLRAVEGLRLVPVSTAHVVFESTADADVPVHRITTALLIGIICAAGAAMMWLLLTRDRVVASVREAEQASGLPVVDVVPQGDEDADRRTTIRIVR